MCTLTCHSYRVGDEEGNTAMIGTTDQQEAQVGRTRQFDTLRRLLAIGATDLRTALNQASQLVAEVLSADKVDVFLLDASGTELTALGVSDTPMGRHERQIGLDHLALADGGGCDLVL